MTPPPPPPPPLPPPPSAESYKEIGPLQSTPEAICPRRQVISPLLILLSLVVPAAADVVSDVVADVVSDVVADVVADVVSVGKCPEQCYLDLRMRSIWPP